MPRMDKEHEHIRITLSVEKRLYELFEDRYPHVNLSHLLEIVMQEILRRDGINYELYEDKFYKEGARLTIESLKRYFETWSKGKLATTDEIVKMVKKR